MSSTSASSLLAEFMQTQELLSAGPSGTAAGAGAVATSTDGIPPEPGVAPATAGFFSNMRRVFLGDRKHKKNGKDQTASLSADQVWAPYLNSKKDAVAAANYDATEERARAALARVKSTSVNLRARGPPAAGTAGRAAEIAYDENARAELQKIIAASPAGTAEHPAFDFSDEIAYDARIRESLKKRNDTKASAAATKSKTAEHPVFDFSDEIAYDERVRESLKKLNAKTSATARKVDFSWEKRFDEDVRNALQKSKGSSVAARAPSTAASGTEKVWNLAANPGLSRDADAEARAAERARQRDAQFAALLNASTGTGAAAMQSDTAGFARALRDKLVGTVEMRPLSRASSVPLAAKLADKKLSSDSLRRATTLPAEDKEAEVPEENDILKIKLDKTAGSLAMTVLPRHIPTGTDMQGLHYSGLQAQTLRKDSFFSVHKGIRDPVRASVSFRDPVTRKTTSVNLRPKEGEGAYFVAERAWVAVLPSSKHILVFRFGPENVSAVLEDFILFYVPESAAIMDGDTDTLAPREAAFADLLVQTAATGRVMAPDSVLPAPIGTNAYASSVMLATAMARHRALTGTSIDAARARLNNQPATASQSAQFHQFARHVQGFTDDMQRAGVAPVLTSAQKRGESFYAHTRAKAAAAGVTDAALHQVLAQAWQTMHLQATRGVPQHTERRLDSFSRVPNVTSDRVQSLVQDYLA